MVNLNNKKGISLIVLVITIIVMIILATAIILALNGNNIIGKAKDAVTSSTAANAKHVEALARAEYDLGGIPGTFQEYANTKLREAGIPESEAYVTADNSLAVGPAAQAIHKNIKIGDKVSYTPIAGEYDGYKTEDCNIQEWVYLGISAEGKMLITSATKTVQTYTPDGASAWLNFETYINTVCNKLFSSNLGRARSMNLEDVDRTVGYNGSKNPGYSDANGAEVKINSISGTVASFMGNTNWISSPYKTPDGVNTLEALSKYALNDYWYYRWKDNKEVNGINSNLNASEDIYKLIFEARALDGSGWGEHKAWLANKSVKPDIEDKSVDFRIYMAYNGGVLTTMIFNSRTGSRTETGKTPSASSFRPVVELKDNVKIGEQVNGVYQLSM